MGRLLTLSDVSLRYDRRRATALVDVTLEVGVGEYVAVWGPRRSGRSSVLAVAAGLIAPTRGRVLFDGRPPREHLGRERGIGWAVDGPDVFVAAAGGTVLEQAAWPAIGLMQARRARARADELLVRCALGELADLSAHQLSDAERVRLLVARALMREPRLLLLDEPTAGVPAPDARALSELLRSLVRREGISVLLTTDESGPLAGSRSVSLQRGVLRGRLAAPRGSVVDLEDRRAPGL